MTTTVLPASVWGRAPAAPSPPPVAAAAPGSSVVTPAARRRPTTDGVGLGGQELGQAGRDHPAHAVHGGELLGAGPLNGLERSEGAGHRPGPGRADMADAQRDEQAAERLGLRGLDGGHQVGGRDGTEALEPDQLLDGEVVEVGRVVDQPGRHELHHPLLAQVLDVHGRTRGVVGDALHTLGRAVDVGAVGVALTRQAHERFADRPGTSSGTSTSACAGPARRARGVPVPPPRG